MVGDVKEDLREAEKTIVLLEEEQNIFKDVGVAALTRVSRRRRGSMVERRGANAFSKTEMFLPLQRCSSMVERRDVNAIAEAEMLLPLKRHSSMVQRRGASAFFRKLGLLPQWRCGANDWRRGPTCPETQKKLSSELQNPFRRYEYLCQSICSKSTRTQTLS
ncbi:hypothetical protein RND71_039889 [Anisodus tanguticus]|uniref:Uncharacterized protein n=1 Tax=Anisodus tanguticus TaxID=243964 RepID=A0AAE1QY81_9SOLA|nr:hypothetical protein RND71_039889 [Anisodus tanguticus]